MPQTLTPAPLRDRLTSLRRQLRRGLLRHRRLIVAGCLAGAVASGLQTLAPPPPATVAVTVAARDLPAGHALAASDLAVAHAPPELAPQGALSASAVLGRTLAAPLRRGTALTDAAVLTGRLLRGFPGKVALPVRLPDAGAVALLRPGDRIDLIATRPADGSVQQVADGVAVITVPAPAAGGSTLVPGSTGALVVLAVSEAEARQIAGASASMYLAATISR